MRSKEKGELPFLYISGKTLPEAYEKTLVRVWDYGIEVPTHYDRPGDPASKEATVMVNISEPFSEPRITKLCPGGPQDLEIYHQEFIKGIHDHWMDPSDPNKWAYTYHDRLFAYTATDDLKDPNALKPFKPVDQIEYIINNLAKSWYSRRAQAITWIPMADPKITGAPCLQRVWARVLKNKNDNYVLNLNTHWRSRDLWGAWFMNDYGGTYLQKLIAEELSSRLGEEVKIGPYKDISDSLHIYGKDFEQVEPRIRAIKSNPDYKQRAWSSSIVEKWIEETRLLLLADQDFNRKPDSERPHLLEDKVQLSDGTLLTIGEDKQLYYSDGNLYKPYKPK